MNTATAVPRRPSGDATRMPGPLGVLRAQVLAELRSSYRVPEYVIGVVAVPIILYLMFGLPNAGQTLPGGTDVGAMLFGSMSAYGVVSLAIFGFGVSVADERGKGWLRRMRATPMPFWAYFAAKVAGALAFTVLILGGTLVVALGIGGVAFEPRRLALALAVLAGGTLAFSTMGFALAYWFRPKAATAIGNLIFLPMAFLSGFFVPLAQLPDLFGDLARLLPSHHFGQLVWSALAPHGDIAAFGSLPSGSVGEHLAWVLGGFAAFGVLAVVGYRRELSRSAQ